MKKQDKLLAQKIYLVLGSLFITSLVAINMYEISTLGVLNQGGN